MTALVAAIALLLAAAAGFVSGVVACVLAFTHWLVSHA